MKVNKGSYITAAQIEAARKATNKFVKKNGDMIIKIFTHLIKTKKPIGVRMGCGKGARVGYVAVVREGTIIIEVSGLEKKKAYEALLAAKYKIPGKCECEVIELEKKEKSSKKNEKNYNNLRKD